MARSDNSNLHRMDDALRQMARDPALYDDFITAWDRLTIQPGSSDAEVVRASEDALRQIDQDDRRRAARQSLARDINRFPYPTCLADCGGDVLAANDAAYQQFGVETGAHLDDLGLELEAAEPFSDMISGVMSRVPPTRELTLRRAYRQSDGGGVTLAVLPTQGGGALGTGALVFIIDPGRQALATPLLRQAYDLTEAETEVLAAFLAGDSLRNIARKRERSEATVRSNSIRSFQSQAQRHRQS